MHLEKLWKYSLSYPVKSCHMWQLPQSLCSRLYEIQLPKTLSLAIAASHILPDLSLVQPPYYVAHFNLSDFFQVPWSSFTKIL